ncbi:MAG: 16S rRNA (uracil(1498)-N(3))-methyltransferase [Ruminococcaceae bacterium]|nr:16S rRNA (uracil(1498)-N(3))-methyltransferase [Oscillospiraceae bacterium]
MSKFFVGAADIVDNKAVLTGETAGHITKSLRMMPGECVTLCDGAGTDYFCRIDSVGREVCLTVEDRCPSVGEPPYRAVIYQGLSKGDRFDTVVQKSVECGAAAIVPVQTERATVRLSRDDCDRKNVRWQRIAESAAEQCGRGIIPEMKPLMSFSEAVEAAKAADLALFCYENEDGVTLKERLETFAGAISADVPLPEIAVLIGPEGGFSEREAETVRAAMAESENFHSVTLGPRILRTESAAPFALACISMTLEM